MVQHSLFWVLSYYILLRVFSTGSEPHTIDYIYTALFHFRLFLGVYINLEFMIPKFLRKEYFLFYFVGASYVILLASQVNILFFDYFVDIIFADYYFISYYDFLDIIQFFLIYISITSLLKLSRGWFQLAKTEEKLALANRKKLEAELKVLKSQINPHFLFNSLNNLYSLALKKDAKTPEVILQLSESMRYIIYECNADRVLLQS